MVGEIRKVRYRWNYYGITGDPVRDTLAGKEYNPQCQLRHHNAWAKGKYCVVCGQPLVVGALVWVHRWTSWDRICITCEPVEKEAEGGQVEQEQEALASG